MPSIKNWQGAGSMDARPDPMANPTEGSASGGSRKNWQGAYGAEPKPDPTEKPAGSAKTPKG